MKLFSLVAFIVLLTAYIVASGGFNTGTEQALVIGMMVFALPIFGRLAKA